MSTNKFDINYSKRLCQCQIELKKLIRIIPSEDRKGQQQVVVQHNSYLSLMFTNCFQPVKASIRRVHATL